MNAKKMNSQTSKHFCWLPKRELNNKILNGLLRRASIKNFHYIKNFKDPWANFVFPKDIIIDTIL